MGDLALDTAVEGGSGTYRGRVAPGWEIWGPNGGYLAAIALRAAGAETAHTRPASFTCRFLESAEVGPVEVRVHAERRSRRADALGVELIQDGRALLRGSAWIVRDGVTGLDHDFARHAPVAAPSALRTMEEHMPGAWPWSPFWHNLEMRPLVWLGPEKWEPGEPEWRCWQRFRPAATFDDPIVDAARYVIQQDVCSWSAALAAHKDVEVIAPTLDLSVQFHRRAPESAWLFVEGVAPVAKGGLVGCQGRVWSSDGRLLASGLTHLMCKGPSVA